LNVTLKRAESLTTERDELALTVERLQNELKAAEETIEARDQQVRHLQIDLASANVSPDPQVAVQNAIALASHHALHQEQRLRAKAEEKLSWLHTKLQESDLKLQNEKLEHSRSRRKLEAMPAKGSGFYSTTGSASGPMSPYTMSQTASVMKKKKPASSGKLPKLP
jgi:hypothetical protein